MMPTSRPASIVSPVPCAVCGTVEALVAPIRTPRDAAPGAGSDGSDRSRWVICAGCGLVFQSPRPQLLDVDELYLEGGYHESRGGVSEAYTAYSLRRSVDALDWALSVPGMPASGRALDIGCGLGGALVHLRGKGFDVVGVEPDPELSEVARSRFGLDVTTALFDEQSMATLGRVDLAYSCHVWEHLVDPVATTSLVGRLLAATGGAFCIVVPTYRRARTWVWSNFSSPHTYIFDDCSLGNVLRLSGFEVIEHRYAAAADSEIWITAVATGAPASTGAIVRQDAEEVYAALRRAPLTVPLGLPGRARTHARTLLDDPADFADRLQRWSRRQADRARSATR
jgi:SAM-dependent methyltransferase